MLHFQRARTEMTSYSLKYYLVNKDVVSNTRRNKRPAAPTNQADRVYKYP